MWKRKRKLEREAPEAAIFYGSGSGSGSGKPEMNGSGSGSGSGSSKKILEAEAGAIKNSPLPHHWLAVVARVVCGFSNRLLDQGHVGVVSIVEEEGERTW